MKTRQVNPVRKACAGAGRVPSQMAQALMPRLQNCFSPSMSSRFAVAPVATMTLCARTWARGGDSVRFVMRTWIRFGIRQGSAVRKKAAGLRVARLDALSAEDAERTDGQINGLHVVRDELRAPAVRLGAHAVHQVRPRDAVWEAREVLHVGGAHQLPAGHAALGDALKHLRSGGGAASKSLWKPLGSGGHTDHPRWMVSCDAAAARQAHQRFQVRSPRVDGGSVSGWATADDNHVLHTFCGHSILVE